MSQKEKLIVRLKSQPSDFTFDEAEALLKAFGYTVATAGKTGGSRVAFGKGADYIRLHKPHPRNVLKKYQVSDLLNALKERGYL